MVALGAGEDDVLEQRLLEGVELEFEGAEQRDVRGRKRLRPPRELRRLVRGEVPAANTRAGSRGSSPPRSCFPSVRG